MSSFLRLALAASMLMRPLAVTGFSASSGRRSFLQEIIPAAAASKILQASTSSLPLSVLLLPRQANAASERRQLELCTATVLRVKYWSENVALGIQRNIDRDSSVAITSAMKGPYLEARLGAKAVLSAKVGGGANLQVYNLASLQLRGCVKDAIAYSNDLYKDEMKGASSEQKGRLKREKQIVDDAAEDIIESIAAVVEFDGLDNVKDPSPRSSLALAQYTDAKATYVKRILLERTVPACNTFVRRFGSDKMRFVEGYLAKTYPNELPLSLRLSTAAAAAAGDSVSTGLAGL